MFGLSNQNKCKKTLNILLAEDEDLYQQIMENYAQSLGISLTIVENGNKCIAKANESDFDIILMDIEMPEKNGLETTQELRRKGITTPIIAVTSNTWREDEIISKESGMNDFLAKPVNKNKLAKIIRFWTREREKVS